MDHLEMLHNEKLIKDTIALFFKATDDRNWDIVKGCLTSSLRLDNSSLSGQEPKNLRPDDIVEAWKEGFGDMDQLHHNTSDMLVAIEALSAKVYCNCTTLHYYGPKHPQPLKTFVGEFEFELRKGAEFWQISKIKYIHKFMQITERSSSNKFI